MLKHHCLRAARILVSLFAVFALSVPARADIAPPAPPKGSNISPGSETTNVRMMDETVTIEVASQSAYDTGNATVTAVFHMRNLGDTVERMDVRFPLLAISEYSDAAGEGGYYSYPPIDHFTAWINGARAQVHNTYEELQQMWSDENTPDSIPTWANFPVTFPPEKDVEIRVQYIQQGYGGYDHGSVNYVIYTYLLFTGAGWKDNIGSADIIVRLPVEANEATVHYYSPDGAAISGKEIRWHFEDFEPLPETTLSQIKIGILQPSYWLKIQEYQKQVAARPKDGESWGQLGKAYKEAARMERGFRQDAVGEQWYWESFEAYKKAVALLPKDADWHYGFAELLFHNFSMDQFNRDPYNYEEQIRLCLEQLKLALEINPNHGRAGELLQFMATWNEKWVDISGPQPDYLFLTPEIPTDTAQPAATSTAALTATVTRTATLPPTMPPTIPPTLASTSVLSTPTAQPASQQPFCGAVFALGMIVAALLLKRYLAASK